MKNFFLIAVLLGLIVLGFNHSTVRSQETNDKIKIRATIVGLDTQFDGSELSFAPKSQILIIRTDKVFSGNEEAEFLKVVYDYKSKINMPFTNVISKKKVQWMLTLSRNLTCDSSLKEAKYNEGVVLEDNIDIKDIDPNKIENLKKIETVRLKDIGGLNEIPETTNLPCYSLISGKAR